MNLGKYIQHLLLENEVVIVPGFGAFISEYQPAQVNEESGEMTPPSKKVYFDSKIKNNDGLLAGEVARRGQISVQEALQKIEHERDEIYYQLDKGNRVTLENTGLLFYDENRNIQFEPSGEKNLLLDSYGLESTALDEELEKVAEKKQEDTPVAGFSEENGEQPEPEKGPEPVNTFQQDEPQPEGSPEKKKRGWLWFLLLLIPIIAAGIFILQKENEEPPEPAEIKIEPPAKKEQPVQIADTMVADSAKVQQMDTVNTEKAIFGYPDYIEPDTTKFYLVGGSFQDAENAEKYLQKMNKKGYKPFHLGKQGSFYLVGLEIYDNEIEAYGAQYNFLDKFPDSGVWVFIPE